jgi:serine/threonine protein kinase
MSINPTTCITPSSLSSASSSSNPAELELHSPEKKRGTFVLKSPIIFRRIPNDPTSTTTLITTSSAVFNVYNRHQAGHQKLGQGAKKKVYTAAHRKTGKVVAYLSSKTTPSRPHAIYQEYMLNLLLKDAGCEPIEGSYLIKPWGSKKDGTHREVYLAKKWNGDLFDLIALRPDALLDWPNTSFSIALQLSYIICRLHALNYIHRDFKLENILYGLDETGGLILRLSDLDSAIKIGSPVDDSPGTPHYLPPEMVIALATKTPLAVITKRYDGWQLGIALRLAFTQWWDHPLFGPYITKAMNIKSSADYTAFEPYALRIFNSAPSLQSEWISKAAPDGDPVDYAIYKLQQFDPSKRWTPLDCYTFLSALKKQEPPSPKRQRTQHNS